MMSACSVNEVLLCVVTATTYNEIFRKYIADKDTRNEFKQFIYLTLLEQHEKTLLAWNENYFRYYLLRIISNQIKSNDSSYHKIYRKHKFESLDHHLNHQEEMKMDVSNIYELIEKIIDTKVSEKPKLIMHFNLWKLYYIQELTFHEVSAKTKIPVSSVLNYVNKATGIIKRELEIKYL